MGVDLKLLELKDLKEGSQQGFEKVYASSLGLVLSTGVELHENKVFEEPQLLEGSWVGVLGIVESLKEVELVVLNYLDLFLKLFVG